MSNNYVIFNFIIAYDKKNLINLAKLDKYLKYTTANTIN